VTASLKVLTSEIRKTVTTTTTAMTSTAMPSIAPILLISRCSGVGCRRVSSSIVAMAPTSVSMPVAVTTARPVPCTIAVPLNTMPS
jgi:hypothetical protein